MTLEPRQLFARAVRRLDELTERAPWLRAPATRRAAALLALLITIGWTRWAFDALTGPQQARVFPDSSSYLVTAAEPLSSEHLFYPKPFTVPAVYRLVDAVPDRIVGLQCELAFWSWWALGLSLCAVLHRPRARIAAVVATVALLLAPIRLGWTGTVLSESICDSLFALTIAAALLLTWCATAGPPSRRRSIACGVSAGVLFATGSAWLFSRDTNAIAVLGAVPVAIAIWRPHRMLRSRPWGAALVVGAALAATLSIWSAGVIPHPSPKVPPVTTWLPEAQPRAAFSMVNNLFVRVLTNPEAVRFFRERGMPWDEELQSHANHLAFEYPSFFVDPKYRPLHQWLAEHGKSTWLLWLLQHPLDRADEVVALQWAMLAEPGLHQYMPVGWKLDWPRHRLADLARSASTNRALLFLLLIVAPLCVRQARRPLAGVAGCVIVGAMIALPAAYYGDAAEFQRHCYGPGQQLILGLVMMVLARLDRAADRA